MSFAIDYLEAHLAQTSQAEFALRCGIDPSTLTKLLKGEVAISGKNVPKLLLGFSRKRQRQEFLTAYLRDEIPAEHSDEITISIGIPGALCESDIDEKIWVEALASVASQLPPHTQEQLYHLARALRHDASLRDVFKGIMRYVPRAPMAEVQAAPHPLEQALRDKAAGNPPQQPQAGQQSRRPAPAKGKA